MSVNAAQFFVAQRTLRLLYSQQTGFRYLPEWLLDGFLINNTKLMNVRIIGFIKTLIQFHRLFSVERLNVERFSVERYVVFNKLHSEWRQYYLLTYLLHGAESFLRS